MNACSLLMLGCFLISSLAQAEELAMFVGKMEKKSGVKSENNWQIEYRYNFNRYASLSGSYLNEGHFSNHNRDGLAGQFWANLPLFSQHFALALGAGLYQYYDTLTTPDLSHDNKHGSGAIYSASATLYSNYPWFARFIYNRIAPFQDMNTNNFLLGIGYLFPEDTIFSPEKTDIQTSVFFGHTTVNSLQNHNGINAALEMRFAIAKYLDWTLSWLYENSAPLVSRNGLASQIWLSDKYFNRHFEIGIGIGPYGYIDYRYPRETGTIHHDTLSWLVSATLGYKFTDHWLLRFIWNRVTTNYDRDNDDFMLGLGYSW